MSIATELRFLLQSCPHREVTTLSLADQQLLLQVETILDPSLKEVVRKDLSELGLLQTVAIPGSVLDRVQHWLVPGVDAFPFYQIAFDLSSGESEILTTPLRPSQYAVVLINTPIFPGFPPALATILKRLQITSVRCIYVDEENRQTPLHLEYVPLSSQLQRTECSLEEEPGASIWLIVILLVVIAATMAGSRIR